MGTVRAARRAARGGEGMYFADLHIHSHWSMATSRDCDLPHLDWWARRKGVALVGTGDFTHPAWRAELRSQLTPAGEGVYALRKEYRLDRPAPGGETRFLVTGEVNCVYRRDGRVRRVHHLILLPSLEAGERPLEAVEEQLAAQLLQQAQNRAWTESQAQWREETDVVIHEDRLGY